MEPMELSSEEGEVPPEETPAPIEIPLAVNEDAGIQAIVTSYYSQVSQQLRIPLHQLVILHIYPIAQAARPRG